LNAPFGAGDAMNDTSQPKSVTGTKHWTSKDGGEKLFLFEKIACEHANTRGTILRSRSRSIAAEAL
jgi:hypothetical protein